MPGPVLWIPVSESQIFLNLTLAVNVKKIYWRYHFGN